jgi:hypothetical protein
MITLKRNSTWVLISAVRYEINGRGFFSSNPTQRTAAPPTVHGEPRRQSPNPER